MESNDYFRAGVGIVVIDDRGLVLGFERADEPGSWQLPQGGIQQSEEPLDAAKRELAEETGIHWQDIDLLDVYPSWLAYELPESVRSRKTGRGQVHRWFLVRYQGANENITLKPPHGEQEFDAWRWMQIDDLVVQAWRIRRPAYRALATSWSDYLM